MGVNRRTLLGMVIGVLAGASLPNLAWPAVERNLTMTLGHDTVFTSMEARRAIAPLIRTGIPIAELFVSVGADVSAAIAGLTALGTELDVMAECFKNAKPAALLVDQGVAKPLIINTPKETERFVKSLTAAILESQKPAKPWSI